MLEQNNLFGIEEEQIDTKYSINVEVPQYLPKNKCPRLDECFNNKKYQLLISDIAKSNLSEEEKDFLRLAASRHIIFNYSLVADYYAHASEEMQQLMEDSALVLIDYDDALANGYVKLSDKIHQIAKASKSYKKKLEKYSND